MYEELSEVRRSYEFVSQLHDAKAARTDGLTEQTEADDIDDGTRRDGTDGQRTDDDDDDRTGDGADDWTDRWTEENDADDGPTHEEYADFLQPVAPDQTRLDEFRRTRNV